MHLARIRALLEEELRARVFPGDFGAMSDASVPNLRSSCLSAVHRISGEQRERPVLFYSGGSKSEIMLRAWIESAAAYDVAIVKTKCNSWLELQRASEFCRKHGIAPILLEIDEFRLFEEGQLGDEDLLSSSRFASRLVKLAARSFLDSGRPLVLGVGIPILEDARMRNPAAIAGEIKRELDEARFARGEGLTHFFSSDERLLTALFAQPLVGEWLEMAKTIPFDSIRYFLDFVFMHEWPDFDPRPSWDPLSLVRPQLRHRAEARA